MPADYNVTCSEDGEQTPAKGQAYKVSILFQCVSCPMMCALSQGGNLLLSWTAIAETSHEKNTSFT